MTEDITGYIVELSIERTCLFFYVTAFKLHTSKKNYNISYARMLFVVYQDLQVFRVNNTQLHCDLLSTSDDDYLPSLDEGRYLVNLS